jgi:hypothetical protein
MRQFYELGRAIGGTPIDPAAEAFDFDVAAQLMDDQFQNVRLEHYPSRLEITDTNDLFRALTSFPPGDSAEPEQLSRLRDEIEKAMEHGGGVLSIKREMGLLLSIKKI